MKKNLFTLICTIILVGFTPNLANTLLASQSRVIQLTNKETIGSQDLSRKNLEELFGRKLTFREKTSLFFIKSRISNTSYKGRHLKNQEGKVEKKTGKLQIVAFLLCLFLGLLGIHRFYLGYTGMGILYLLTAGLFGIGWLIDFILLIIPNGLTPKGETRY